MSRKRYLIVGDGAAGATAAQYIRQADPSGIITIYSDDPNPAYFRAALTNYLLGELREDQIWAVPPTFYGEAKVNRVLARVAAVEAQRSQIWLASGGPPEGYDALLVGAGARARPAAFEGAGLHGVMTMRTLQDVRRVMDLIKLHGLKRAVVLGGGPLALEWALGLRVRGVEVTMIMRDERFMPGALDAVASDLLIARLRQAGVGVRMRDEIRAAIPDRQGRVSAVATRNGETLPCELVAVAIGVICNTEFLQGSGIELGKSGGIVANDRLQSSVPNVFTAGDIAERNGRLLQLWEPARHEARIAAANMTGGDARHTPGVHYMATRLYDLDFASLGEVNAGPGAEEIAVLPRGTGRIAYKKLVLRGGKLVGALLFGEREERVRARGRAFKQLIDDGIDVTPIRGQLLDPMFDLNAWLHTSDITQKPAAPRESMLPMAPPAKVKGTQMVALAPPSMAPPANISAPAQASAVPSAAKMKGTQMVALGGPPIEPARDAMPPPPPAIAGAGPARPRPSTQVVLMQIYSPEAEAPRATTTPAAEHLEANGKRWELRGSVMSIGRDPQDTVVLDDPAVGHVHAQITRHGEDLYLRDLGSSSGTWVNGAAVIVPHRLRDGDRVRVGNTELLFRSSTARGPTILPSMPPDERRAPHLEVRAGHSLGLAFALTQSPITIGSDPRCVVRLDDRGVAPLHAHLQEHQGRHYVCDTSGAGIVRNGARLAQGQQVPLDEGDHLTLGEALLYFTSKPLVAPRIAAPSMVPPAPSVAPPPPRPPRRARVLVRGGVDAGNAVEIGDRVLVGQQIGACHLLLRDPRVGPVHLEIMRHEGAIFARDMGAPAGTWRLGQHLGAQPVRLTHGDALYLGPDTVIVFEEEP